MPTNSKSIFCASMHKAGSTIIDDILIDFCQARGLAMDRISLTAPSSPLSEGEVFVNYQAHMKPEGVYYGVARGPYVARMPMLRQLKVIVQVRDPRDCITSGYFSVRQSHEPPKDPEKRKEFLERRRKLQDLDINRYAASQAGSYRDRMQVLRELIEGHDDILVLKYEDMVLHTEDWLGRIADFIGQPVTEALRAALGDKIDFSVRGEDPARHKRQVTPGDHRRKLEAPTIAALNAKMADQMAFFGYGD
jgi:hypothetical protein